MAGQSLERTALLAYIRERWPLMSAETAEEHCQEALSRALATDGSARGQALLEKAKAELVEMAMQAFWQMKRLPSVSFEALSEDIEGPSEPTQTGRRRVGARRPKGLLPCHGSQLGFEMIKIGTGISPTDETRLCAFLLRTMVFEGIEAKALIPPNVAEQSLLLFRQLFGHGPFDAWANVLLNQVAAAKMASIAPRERTRSPPLSRQQTTLTFVDRKDPSKTQREAPLRTEVLSMRGPLAVVACYGDLGKGNGEQFIGTFTALWGTQVVEYPQDDRDRAAFVLQLTTRLLARLPVPCPIPAYANDVELVVWLEMRLGFQGGGGPHSVKQETLQNLLLDPEQLAASIETHGERIARRVAVDAGEQLEQATQSLAARVRTRAQFAKSS